MKFRRSMFAALTIAITGCLPFIQAVAQDAVSLPARMPQMKLSINTRHSITLNRAWLWRLRFQELQESQYCCYSTKGELDCDDFHTVRYCKEGFDRRIALRDPEKAMWEMSPAYRKKTRDDDAIRIACGIAGHAVNFLTGINGWRDVAVR